MNFFEMRQNENFNSTVKRRSQKTLMPVMPGSFTLVRNRAFPDTTNTVLRRRPVRCSANVDATFPTKQRIRRRADSYCHTGDDFNFFGSYGENNIIHYTGRNTLYGVIVPDCATVLSLFFKTGVRTRHRNRRGGQCLRMYSSSSIVEESIFTTWRARFGGGLKKAAVTRLMDVGARWITSIRKRKRRMETELRADSADIKSGWPKMDATDEIDVAELDHGCRKIPMATGFDPVEVERGWMDHWVARKLFEPTLQLTDTNTALQRDCCVPHTGGWDKTEADKASMLQSIAVMNPERKFIMIIPPPNITGSLHIGHALTVSIEDALCRWNRMMGKVVLWVPGVDHAGIATQSVVERMLLRDGGVTRHDLGREEFLKRVWQWKKEYGNTIVDQLRSIGTSVAWDYFAFTMDPVRSRAVTEAFIRLFDKGRIYRGKRLVSWSCYLKTAISDIEVDTDEIDKPQKISITGFDKKVEVGWLWIFAYKLKDYDERLDKNATKPDENTKDELLVATTRIETMLGDTAVAVHPNDERYKDLIGRRIRHPFFPDREMRVIADDMVDPEFGTGAVKITPAHDKNDYLVGQRFHLDFITIFTPDGKINENGGEFEGQHRFECRFHIQKRLEDMGFLREKIPNSKPMMLPRCSRSGDIVEYFLIDQWWMNCDEAAGRSMDAVRKGELVIQPAHFVSVWDSWLGSIREWCISRQLWWGHRIPAYEVVEPRIVETAEKMAEMGVGRWVAARSVEEAEAKARVMFSIPNGQKVVLKQDEDVLDTWFSSALFPFSSLGWPDDTPEMKAFFPTTILETGQDILFFWVARMVMMSLELLDVLPFRKVFLHPMVRDAQGQKMSKSRGNVVDPLEVINGVSLSHLIDKLKKGNLQEKEVKRSEMVLRKEFPNGIPACGCDALRLGLLAYMRQGRNINLDINRIVGYRHFCNKIWNCVKFALEKFALGNKRFYRLDGVAPFASNSDGRAKVCYKDLDWEDKWILHRLSCATATAISGFESMEFSEVVTAIYQFWLYELCDVYLEAVKRRIVPAEIPTDAPYEISNSCKAAQTCLFICVDRGLRLLHPICPFVTEYLYQRLPFNVPRKRSISEQDYPQATLMWIDDQLDKDMQLVQQIIAEFRSLIATLELGNQRKLNGYIRIAETNERKRIESFLKSVFPLMTQLSKIETLILTEATSIPGSVAATVSSEVAIFLQLDGQAVAKAIKIMEKKATNIAEMVQRYEKKENAPSYMSKAPADVRAANAEKKQSLTKELRQLESFIKDLREAD